MTAERERSNANNNDITGTGNKRNVLTPKTFKESEELPSEFKVPQLNLTCLNTPEHAIRETKASSLRKADVKSKNQADIKAYEKKK